MGNIKEIRQDLVEKASAQVSDGQTLHPEIAIHTSPDYDSSGSDVKIVHSPREAVVFPVSDNPTTKPDIVTDKNSSRKITVFGGTSHRASSGPHSPRIRKKQSATAGLSTETDRYEGLGRSRWRKVYRTRHNVPAHRRRNRKKLFGQKLNRLK